MAMKAIETVSLIGLGAIGSAYLSAMAKALPLEQLRVIAGGSRGQALKEKGVTVNGETLHFPVCEPEQAVEPADLLIFAVKFGGLEQAVQDAAGHVGPDTIILSLLNGINSEEIIGAAFGREKVLYSLAVGIDAVRTEEGVAYSTLGKIPFGLAKNEAEHADNRVQQVADLLHRSGIPCEIPEDMLRTLWWKFMINVGVNQTTAVLRCDYGAVQRPGTARELMLEAFQEVCSMSEKTGVNLTGGDVDEALRILGTLSPEGKTSMAQDVEAGRATEMDIFSGEMLRMGERYGVDVPVNRILHRLLTAYEETAAWQRAHSSNR